MLLVFDIDGTLCDTKTVGDNCFINTFEAMYNCNLGKIQWEYFTNVTDAALYHDLFFQIKKTKATGDEIIKFKLTYESNLKTLFAGNLVSATPGANEFISYCKQQNFYLSIATGNWLNSALIKMDACGLNYKSISISSSDDALRREEILLSAIGKAKNRHKQSDFGRIVYFGDGRWDYECAKNLNIDFVGVDINKSGTLISTNAKHIIPNFTNPKAIVSHLLVL